MRLSLTPGTAAHEFACHSSGCRPPTSGGTGGSRPHGAGGPVHMPLGKIKPTVAKAWTPGKNNVIGKSTPEQQAAARARLDRAMGIKPQQPSLKETARQHANAAPMRDVSKLTLKGYDANGKRIEAEHASGLKGYKSAEKEAKHQAAVADIRKRTGYKGDEMGPGILPRHPTTHDRKVQAAYKKFHKEWSTLVQRESLGL